MKTIYGMYTSASLTRETEGVSGTNATQGGGLAKFFAIEKIKFFSRSAINFGARIQRDAQRGGIVLPASKTEGADKWNQTK